VVDLPHFLRAPGVSACEGESKGADFVELTSTTARGVREDERGRRGEETKREEERKGGVRRRKCTGSYRGYVTRCLGVPLWSGEFY